MNSTETPSSPARLIDFDQMRSACDGNMDLLRELMEMYFGQADDLLPKLRTAVEKGAVADVDYLAHKLAGSSLACGLSAIVPPLRQMEHGAKAGHLNGADDALAEAVAAFELLRRAVQNYLKENQKQDQG